MRTRSPIRMNAGMAVYASAGAAPPPPSYDLDAQAWFDAVAGQGGTMGAPEKAAFNSYILALKGAGFWSRVCMLYWLGAITPAASLVCMRWLDVATDGGTTHTPGVQRKGSGGYLGTGIDTGVEGDTLDSRGLVRGDAGMVVDVIEDGGNSPGWSDCGIIDGSKVWTFAAAGTEIEGRLAGRNVRSNDVDPVAYWTTGVSPAEDLWLYREAALNVEREDWDEAGTELAGVTATWRIFGFNTPTEPSSFNSGNGLGCMILLAGLTRAEAVSLRTINLALRSALWNIVGYSP